MTSLLCFWGLMESTGSLKTVEEISLVSTQENVFKSSFSILHSAIGHSQPHGLHALNSKTSLAEFSRNFTTQRMLAMSGTISQTMCSISNGVNQNSQKIVEL